MSWAKRVVDQTQRGADRMRGVASGEEREDPGIGIRAIWSVACSVWRR